MVKKNYSSLPLWEFENFPSNGLNHYVSGRAGGVSLGEKGEFNLSYMVGDDPLHVSENRRRLSIALKLDLNQFVFPQQTHSINVKLVDSNTLEGDLSNTDAVITNTKGICINVMSADCVSILIYDPVKRVIAAVHAGWKGTVGKILSHTIKSMVVNFNCKCSDLIAGIGPSISPQVYEVGEEVISEVRHSFNNAEDLITLIPGSDKAFFNLWEANRCQLVELGVPEHSIEVAGICTFQESVTFFSARRSKNQAGRFAAGIVLV